MTVRGRIIDFFYQQATGKKKTRVLLTPLVGTAFFFAVVLAVIISFYLDRLLGFPQFISKNCAMVISAPFLTIGPSLWIWCAWRFLKTKGTPVPVNPPPKLITDGPYTYSRNPMMTGLFILLAGIGILFRSVSLVFVTTPVFMAISILEFKYIEEPELEKRFGEEYTEYKKKTPRIIPNFKR
jgi:protein-S-isoprenylcysteine O-methyltransferase Ste14